MRDLRAIDRALRAHRTFRLELLQRHRNAPRTSHTLYLEVQAECAGAIAAEDAKIDQLLDERAQAAVNGQSRPTREPAA